MFGIDQLEYWILFSPGLQITHRKREEKHGNNNDQDYIDSKNPKNRSRHRRIRTTKAVIFLAVTR